MALYHKYLVCYDIECNKARKKFFDELKGLGLMPLQKSVFWGQLNRAEYSALQRMAREKLNPEKDKCFWLPTSLTEADLKKAVGYQVLKVIDADGYFCL